MAYFGLFLIDSEEAKLINLKAVMKESKGWREATPFPYFVVDDFLDNDVARKLEAEFPSFDDSVWHEYNNALEVKKVCNNWNVFPSLTYTVFSFLNSAEFTDNLSHILFGSHMLSSDAGLNGGGWHIHKRGGILNTHLDYSLHPKIPLERKLNIIVYLNSNWQSAWGGRLGLWGNESEKKPGSLQKQIEPVFNRAVIFDTTCNSWHGLADPLECPESQFRKSMAVYYLSEQSTKCDFRGKALFAPREDQKGDEGVLELIKRRSNVELSAAVYLGEEKD